MNMYDEMDAWKTYDEMVKEYNNDNNNETNRNNIECLCGTENSYTVVNADYDFVCSACGTVLCSNYFEGVDRPRFKTVNRYQTNGIYQGYKHIFHWAEHIKQINVCDPDVPKDLLKLINKQLRKSKRVPRNQNDVKELLRSVDVPFYVACKYIKKNNKMFDLHRRYSERWITFICMYNKDIDIIKMDIHVLQAMEAMFVSSVHAFRYARHTNACDGKTPNCSRVYGCRHSLPKYNYITLQFLLTLDETNPSFGARYPEGSLYKYYKVWLPLLKSQKNMQKLQELWEKMSTISGLKYIPFN